MNDEDRKTPYYLIKCKQFEKNCLDVETSFGRNWGDNFLCGYSVKTNHHPYLIKLAQNRGWLAEVVSNKEFDYAYSLNFGKGQIICNGPVKGEMLQKAIRDKQILNLDHLQEVLEVIRIYKQGKLPVEDTRIGLRINFDLEKKCQGETIAGNKVARFGICYENGDVKKAIDILKECQIPIRGIHMHTSTKSRSLKVFQILSKMVCKLVEEFDLKLDYVDIGGGFFGGKIEAGKPLMNEYAEVIVTELRKKIDPNQVTLIVEPGASVIATSVEYITRVQNIRDVRGEKVITLDGTSLHINPFMVQRKPEYTIENLGRNRIQIQHICGCTCMEQDRFDILYNEKELLLNSRVCFNNAGAYTMAFNSSFIINPPKVYLVRE